MGTVGSCHVFNVEISKIFRKHASLDALQHILQHPSTHVQIDKRLVILNKIENENLMGQITDGGLWDDKTEATGNAKEVWM